MNKSKLPISWISNLILRSKTLNPKSPILNPNRFLHNSSNPIKFTPILTKPLKNLPQIRQFSEENYDKTVKGAFASLKSAVNDNKLNSPFFLDKLDDLGSDSDSEAERESEFTYREEKKRTAMMNEKILRRHKDLIKSFENAKTFDDAYTYMKKVKKFEEKHFPILPEYRVISELLDRFKVATGKDKFMLAQKLNRAMRMVKTREDFNPDDPANYGIMQRPDAAAGEITDDEDEEKPMGDDDIEFDYMKGRDDIILEKVSRIDKELEEKLAALDYTFGKKGKLLEEEIRDLAEERNTLTEKKKMPMYRKGFDHQLIDINRTCKVTKGGQVVKYTAILVCGNYNGVVGYAKAKGAAVPAAIQKAREKCFQNLHYIDRYEDLTIPHAIQTTYKKTKIYLWPAKTATGVTAGKIVRPILDLAGFKNIKSKVIGSRNPHNTVKAVFMALNAIETPKDIQEKFGRTVIETHLL